MVLSFRSSFINFISSFLFFFHSSAVVMFDLAHDLEGIFFEK